MPYRGVIDHFDEILKASAKIRRDLDPKVHRALLNRLANLEGHAVEGRRMLQRQQEVTPNALPEPAEETP